MEYEFDLKGFCTAVRESRENNFVDRLCDTAGKRYLYNNVLQKFVSGVPVRLREIDLDAFDEDDIVDLLDNKSNEIDKVLRGASIIAENFCKSKAITVKTRKFF